MFERRPFFTTVRHDNIFSVRIWDITAVDIQSHRVSSAELRQACVLPWINLIILFRGNQQSEPENSRGKAGTKRWIEKKRKKKKDSEQLSVLLSFFQLNWHCLQQTPPPTAFLFPLPLSRVGNEHILQCLAEEHHNIVMIFNCGISLNSFWTWRGVSESNPPLADDDKHSSRSNATQSNIFLRCTSTYTKSRN